jgi:glycosyltransferase involved in cell wall biosynthesis
VPVTLVVEPDHNGHRFQAVANTARFAARSDEIVLLTSKGASATERFQAFLGDVDLKVEERLDAIYPTTRDLVRAVADLCRTYDVRRVVVMEADQFIKRWWYVAPPTLRRLTRRPQVIFFVNRYPTRIRFADRHDWLHLVSKAWLTLLGYLTGALDRVGCFAGREDLSQGLLLKRVRGPAICQAHSRDRAEIRARLGLPADRRLAAIVGVIDARKCLPMVFDAVRASGPDLDLLLGGRFEPEQAAWYEALDEQARQRIVVRNEFLSDQVLDELVAASDVVAVAQLNKGPSGIMGKALAAEVPVVTAGSAVRASEVRGTKGGLAAELSVDGLADAFRILGRRGVWTVDAGATPPATAEVFAAAILGEQLDGTPLRQPFSRRR